MKSYCVFHDGNEFVTMKYQTFKENQDTSVVHFIGTQQECKEFVNRSILKQKGIKAQELVDSANREYKEETYTREEVYLVAQRSVHAVINNLLTDNRTRTMEQVINSEIDTVKLF